MSDPDLYHSDPMRRYAAQQREDARMRKASLPPSQSKKSTNSYNFNNSGSGGFNSNGGGAGLDGMGLLIGGLFLGVASLAYGAIHVSYGLYKYYRDKKTGSPSSQSKKSPNPYNLENSDTGGKNLNSTRIMIRDAAIFVYQVLRMPYGLFKYYLNKKAGLPPYDDRNNKKAGILTAISLGSIATIVGIHEIKEHHYNEKYPSISIAYNTRTSAIYVADNPDSEEARETVLSRCHRGAGRSNDCRVRKTFPAGERLCLSYGMYAGRPLIISSAQRPEAGTNPASEACEARENNVEDSSSLICRRGFRTVCNFD